MLKYLGKEPWMSKRALGVLTITVVSFILGIAMMIYQSNSLLLVFPEGIMNLLIVSTVFTLGFLFFGYITPFPMFFVGTHIGELINKPSSGSPEIAFLGVAAFLSAYSSIMLGEALLKDMTGRGNFLKVLKVSMVLLVLSLILAGAGDFLV